jgi:hypothetical protein
MTINGSITDQYVDPDRLSPLILNGRICVQVDRTMPVATKTLHWLILWLVLQKIRESYREPVSKED